ncbi:hypothetical protein ACH5RR_027425 [Cinchona calisaya]|uniref:Uncharacterized protein n=1 Tax=Cinchona calisaya TaxID=153742 RepID=A0ABD2Z5E7_9GENT
MELHMRYSIHSLVQIMMSRHKKHGNMPISYKEAKAIWEALIKKFTTEDATKQKFVGGKFYQWQMTDENEIKVQTNKYQKLLEDLKAEEILLPEKFATGVLIEKLPDLWNDYKNNLKHKQKTFTIEEPVTNILIEDTNRKEFGKEMALKANLVQSNNKSSTASSSGEQQLTANPGTGPCLGYQSEPELGNYNGHGPPQESESLEEGELSKEYESSMNSLATLFLWVDMERSQEQPSCRGSHGRKPRSRHTGSRKTPMAVKIPFNLSFVPKSISKKGNWISYYSSSSGTRSKTAYPSLRGSKAWNL